MMRLSLIHNKKGVSFAVALMVTVVLITVSAGYMLSVTTEFNTAKRYQNSAKAFWLAEAGLAYYRKNPTMVDNSAQNLSFVSGSTVNVSKSETTGSRVVTFLSTYGGTTRTLKATFPPVAPSQFNNSISSGHDLTFSGLVAALTVTGKTRLSGVYTQSGVGVSSSFTDKLTGQATSTTKLTYPDSNSNGTADEFADFKKFYQDLASTYPASQVVYVHSDSSVLIYPNNYLAGKKLVFIEGTSAGQGDVNILFDTTWRDNENITIVSTGDITYLQPLTVAKNSKLNTVSWEDYNEGAVLISSHAGATYTHDDANFGDVISLSTSKGSLIANDNVAVQEIFASKTFNYESPVSATGSVPPGFEGLITTGTTGFQTTPSLWQEI